MFPKIPTMKVFGVFTFLLVSFSLWGWALPALISSAHTELVLGGIGLVVAYLIGCIMLSNKLAESNTENN